MRAALVVLVVALGGCAQWAALVSEQTAQGADSEYRAAKWAYCRTPTAGAIDRAMPNDADKLKYFRHCRGDLVEQ